MDKLYGLIQDINPKEICNHIENGNLAEWCNAWRIAAKEALQPKTNADRIRAMTDRELAEWICGGAMQSDSACSYCEHNKKKNCDGEVCQYMTDADIILAWLMQPAEVE